MSNPVVFAKESSSGKIPHQYMETQVEARQNERIEMDAEVYGKFMEALLKIRVQEANDTAWVQFSEIAQVLALYLDSKGFVSVMSGFIPMCFNFNPSLAYSQLQKLLELNERSKTHWVNRKNPKYANLGQMIQIVTLGYKKIKDIVNVSYDSPTDSLDSLNG